MTQPSKFSAVLATGRISNLPTVWSNVLVGFLWAQLSTRVFTDAPSTELTLPILIATALAASLLYVGGCFLGDAIDVEFDRAHKPDRPIPSGLLSRSSVSTAAAFMLTAGAVLPSAFLFLSNGKVDLMVGLTTFLLSGSIVAYSIWHKRSPWAGLPLIGACRFFLVLFAATAAFAVIQPAGCHLDTITPSQGLFPSADHILTIAALVGSYTICFASVARSESSPKPITWRKALIAIMLLLPTAQVWLAPYCAWNFPSLCALSLYWLWMGFAFSQINRNKGRFVSMSLAGFCLLDACFASHFGWLYPAICLLLFLMALAMQRWAPAT